MGIKAVIVPDALGEPSEALFTRAGEFKTAMAGGKLCLYTTEAGALGTDVTAALLDANEADYDGYTPGGVTIAAAGDPYLDQDGEGYLVSLPSTQFNYTDGDDHIANSVAGAYYKDAAGKLRGVFPFGGAVNMGNNTNSVVVSASWRIANPAE